jgi:DNA-binding XRE family transcriptional regulator
MTDFRKLYDAVIKAISEYEEEAKNERQKRALMIPQQLKLYRIQHGFSKEALAKRLGVSRMEIFRWENGHNVPGEDKMRQLEEMKIINPIK